MQQRIEAKTFKTAVSHKGQRCKLNCSDKFPQIFTVAAHAEYAAVLWFESQDYDNFPVPLLWDNTRYPRLVFLCPSCCKKRLHLYGAANGWACRVCLKLHYSVQSMGTEERLRKRIRKQRKAIWGADASLDTLEWSYPFDKPKRARRQKFADAVYKLNKAELSYLECFEQRFVRLSKRIGVLAKEVDLI
ncbi:hypothetical protein L2750_04775 [Shewanella submarina]|uniref:Uncharacterized protein n=1 Tax=Shewanella submarina TaxID=2016376 RepID=A0ABV7GH07_9GAMM|nr:hypothetical protein [Shewanella submarina]MCL1036465.1 hypothetical protein [Shewanella submarina]